MNTKRLRIILYFVVAFIGITGGIYYYNEVYLNEYVPYQPRSCTVQGYQGYYVNMKLLTEEHKKAFMEMADCFGREYKLINNTIYIPRRINNDDDWMLNITNKVEAYRDSPKSYPVVLEYLERRKQKQQEAKLENDSQ